MSDNEELLKPGRFLFIEKMTERQYVAYTCFRGVINIPSRIWMVRDWAKRKGCHLIGSPRIVLYPNGHDPEQRPCEVQWGLAEDSVPADGEISLKWSDSRPVVATYHLGGAAAIQETIDALSAWGQAKGIQLTGTSRELYYSDPQVPHKHWITEVQLYVDTADQAFLGAWR